MVENIRLSFQGIFSHKMRSFLTMLGIIIGIAAIIAIVSTIKGTNDQIKENLVGSGNNIVKVNLSQNGYAVSSTEVSERGGNVPVIDDDVIKKIEELSSVKKAVKYHQTLTYSGINYLDNSLNGVSLIGGGNDYIEILSYDLIRGRMFVDKDFSDYRNVVILDSSVSKALFQGEDPIDKTIEIKGIPFVVVGVIALDNSFQPVVETISDWQTYYGGESSGAMIIPDTSWQEVYHYDEPYQVIVKAKTTEDMTKAGKGAEDILNALFKSSGPQQNSEESIKYKSEDTLEKAKELQRLKSSTSQQLIWIASISLIVGGIGVMNIMLVSVTERTREIGLKKALGARKRTILGQFLTEASVLTSIGGLIGVGAGIGLSYFISKVAEVPVAISFQAIIVSVIFSMVIGIIFGLIPSIKASNLNPIDALRYE